LTIAAPSLVLAPAIFAAPLVSGQGPVTFPSWTPCSHFCRILAIVWVSLADSLTTVARHFTSAWAGVAAATRLRAATAAPSALILCTLMLRMFIVGLLGCSWSVSCRCKSIIGRREG